LLKTQAAAFYLHLYELDRTYFAFTLNVLKIRNETSWLERSPAKHGRLGFILSWVIPKTLKMVSAANLALTLSIEELSRG